MNKWFYVIVAYLSLTLTSALPPRGKWTLTQAGNLMCTQLKKLRKLIKNKQIDLDEYDQGQDLVRDTGGFRKSVKSF